MELFVKMIYITILVFEKNFITKIKLFTKEMNCLTGIIVLLKVISLSIWYDVNVIYLCMYQPIKLRCKNDWKYCKWWNYHE